MSGRIDLTNQRFGNLYVIERDENICTNNGRSHVAWKCLCLCGNVVTVRSDNLRKGCTISCGCIKKKNLREAGINRKNDLTNKSFGFLTVICDSGRRDSDGSVIWKCRCDCGNIVEVSSCNLLRKKEPTISCGCKKSKGEKKIIDILKEMDEEFVTQKTFKNCRNPKTNKLLFFDFYLEKYNLLIEYDGEQHFHIIKNDRYGFEDLKFRDKYKEKWCKDNNIYLHRIPYTDLNIITIEYIEKIFNKYRNS